MNLKLLSVLIALSLSACATHTVTDDAPASDLDALVANVRSDSRPTLLKNGKEYCMEDAVDEDAQDECAGDLEDGLFGANRKLERIFNSVLSFANRQRLQRNPCSRWEKLTRNARCK